MKELSIKEKAERYDKLLVKLYEAKVDNNVCDERYCCVIDDIVPELKESEDEKIRKFLHHTFTVQYLAKDKLGKWHGEPVSNILAWLEKQGEHKHQYESRPRYVGEAELLGANKQGEQKPADKVEPNFKEGDKVYSLRNGLECTIESIDETTYYGDTTNFDIKDQDNWKLVEQKPWSEEIKAAISLLKHIAEEQEKDYCPHNANDLRKAAQYLETCRPQSTWKPSDEMLKALDIAIRAGIQLGSWEEKALRELQNILRALDH